MAQDRKQLLQGFVGLFVIVLLVFSFIGDDDATTAVPATTAAQDAKSDADEPPAHWRQLDRSEEMQAQRLELINQLIANGVILKIETPTDYPRIYVGSVWNDLTFEMKQQFANSTLTYYYAQNPKSAVAVLRDGYTGKDIGRFSYTYGLELY